MTVTAAVIVLALAAATDQATTMLALRRGAVEKNPMMREAALGFVLKAAMVGCIAASAEILRSHGQPALGLLLVLLVAAIWVAIAVHNFLVIRRLR